MSGLRGESRKESGGRVVLRDSALTVGQDDVVQLTESVNTVGEP